MAKLISIFTELATTGRAIVESNQIKSFNKAANAHGLRYEIGPHDSGKTVLITI